MLDAFRKHTKLVIWTVVASFALFGVVSFGTSLSQEESRYAGKVFGKPVTFQEFNRFYKASQIFSYSEDGESPPDPDLIHHKTWQNLIYSRAAKKQNIKVSDDEVRTDLTRLLKAQGFDTPIPSIYEKWVERNFRISPKEFEEMLRDTLRVQKLVQLAANMPVEMPTDEEVKRIYVYDNTTLSAEVVLFKNKQEAEEFSAQVTSSELWDTLVQEYDYDKVIIEEDTLSNISTSWQIPLTSLEILADMEVGQVSGPLLFQGKIGIFLLKGKTSIEPGSLTEEQLREYGDRAYEQKKREAFVSWHLQLLAESNLEDYILKQRSGQ